jgi:hypothetical protein
MRMTHQSKREPCYLVPTVPWPKGAYGPTMPPLMPPLDVFANFIVHRPDSPEIPESWNVDNTKRFLSRALQRDVSVGVA